MSDRTYLAHDLYTNEDENIPDSICDRNGEVTLGLCKVCGQAEGELEQDCPGEKIGGICFECGGRLKGVSIEKDYHGSMVKVHRGCSKTFDENHRQVSAQVRQEGHYEEQLAIQVDRDTEEEE